MDTEFKKRILDRRRYVNERLDRILTKAFADIYNAHLQYNTNMRTASIALAVKRVAEAIKIRGLWP